MTLVYAETRTSSAAFWALDWLSFGLLTYTILYYTINVFRQLISVFFFYGNLMGWTECKFLKQGFSLLIIVMMEYLKNQIGICTLTG